MVYGATPRLIGHGLWGNVGRSAVGVNTFWIQPLATASLIFLKVMVYGVISVWEVTSRFVGAPSSKRLC